MSDVTASVDALELGTAADSDGHRQSPRATQLSDRLEHLRSAEVAPSKIPEGEDAHENGSGGSTKDDQHEGDDGSYDLGSEGRQIVSEIRPDDVD